MKSHDTCIEEVFSKFYEISKYQRKYRWQKENAEILFESLWEAYSKNDKIPHFIGVIYLIDASTVARESVFQVVDGQQRLITLFLFYSAMKNILKENNIEVSLHLTKLLYGNDKDRLGDVIPRFRVEAHYLNKKYSQNRNILEILGTENWKKDYIREIENDKTITDSEKNIFEVYKTFKNMISEKSGIGIINFNKDSLLENITDKNICIEKIKLFRTYVDSTLLVQMSFNNYSYAEIIYDTVNDTGKDLEPHEKFQNTLYHSVEDKILQEKIMKEWEEMLNTLNPNQEENERIGSVKSEAPDDFLRYYINAKHKDISETLTANEIYKWIKKNSDKIGMIEPLFFVKNLKLSAQDYMNFKRGRGIDGKENPYIKNIHDHHGKNSQHLQVLLSGSHLEADIFNYLAEELEKYIIVTYIIGGRNSSDMKDSFAKICSEVREIKKNDDQVKEKIKAMFIGGKEKFRNNIKNSIASIAQSKENSDKKRIRYILGKLNYEIGRNCHAANNNPFLAECLNVDKNGIYHIEHILPEQKWTNLNIDIATAESIGNKTLLEGAYNLAIQDFDHPRRLPYYTKSAFFLTKHLDTEKFLIRGNSKPAIEFRDMPQWPTDNWGVNEIQRRENWIIAQIYNIFGIPEPEELASRIDPWIKMF